MDMEVYFPGGKRVYADYKGFTIETDQPARGGGEDSAPAPFDLFMASIGTCAGIYALGFMQQRGISAEGSKLIMRPQADPTTGMIAKVDLELHLPEGFPEKYRDAVIKRHEPVRREEAPAPAAGLRGLRGSRLMADAFDPKHAGRLEDPARLQALPAAAVVSLLRLTGAETVVDYGAGTGVYTVAVAKAVPDGRVVAVEALEQLAESLRDRLGEELAGRVDIVVTAENAVTEPDATADRVVMVDVLHHLYDEPRALTEVTRLLRPGGLFVVVDWGEVERPVGPPLGHVLGLARAREVIAGMGLRELETHVPGTLLPYHLAIVAAKE